MASTTSSFASAASKRRSSSTGACWGLNRATNGPASGSLHFGSSKISLQGAETAPALAAGTAPGSGNFCLLTDTPIEDVIVWLRSSDVEIVDGPAEKEGAVGKMMSVYFRDPDGNLVELGNRLS